MSNIVKWGLIAFLACAVLIMGGEGRILTVVNTLLF